MSRAAKTSLTPRFLAYLVGLTLAVSLILVTALVGMDRKRLLSDLYAHADRTADELATTLAFPVWNAVAREIDAQLDWVMLDEAVYGVVLEIKDLVPPVQARSRDRAWRPVSSLPSDAAGLIRARRQVLHGDQSIASLEVVYTRRFLEATIAREALLFAAIVAVGILTLAIGLLVVLRTLVFGPLGRIERYAAEVSSGGPPALPAPGVAHGEIASLQSSIERMVGLLGERYAAIEAKEKEFRSLFESSPVPTIELDFSAVALSLASEAKAAGLPPVLLLPRLRSDAGLARRQLAGLHLRSANPSAVRLFGSAWPDGVIEGFTGLVDGGAPRLFLDELEALVSGSCGASGECGYSPGPGRELRLILSFATLAGHEEDWSRVILTLTDITERALAEARLRKVLAEKEALILELFHRTRNSLQTVAGLLVLRESGQSDEASRQELHGVGTCIQAMALAQDQLYKQGDLSCVDLGAYLGELLPQVLEAHKGRIATRVEAERITAVIDVAMPLGIAVAQLASNSAEHGFPGGSRGLVTARLEACADGRVCLSLADDGIGPPPGFDPRRDASMGLELVYALVEGQLKGEVDFGSSGGRGFRCTLRFGLASYERRV